jgi:hypothetical protein
MKYKVQVRWRRGQCLSPHNTLALNDDDVLPVWGVIALGGATAEGMKSLLSVENVIEYFL